MWFKLFDWLRLFSATAIYPILLREVLLDISPFITMMLIVLGLFGNGLYIFSAIAVYNGHTKLYDKLLPFEMLSAVMNNILVMAGEYDEGRYYIEEQKAMTIMNWLWFLSAIVMSQIVFLNVLIAIISDTFDRVWEQRQTYILSSQANILQDWLNVFKHDTEVEKNLYMYIIVPTFQQDLDNWDGKISQIRKLMDRRFDEIVAEVRSQKRELLIQREESANYKDDQRAEAQLTNSLLLELQNQIKSLEQSAALNAKNPISAVAAGPSTFRN